ncbi:hypothetical protein Pelo_5964 [Pelomyxa schiedti]|nr:hypothetical protein Pelo_5964 [Pelomyxa schiedti]
MWLSVTVACLFSLVVVCKGMAKEDIRYVDQSPIGSKANNFLFRGPYAYPPSSKTGTPTDELPVWDHYELLSGVREAAEKANVTSYPASDDEIVVVDVSLLTVEWDMLVAESEFYAQRPSLGMFSHWPQFGTNLNASDLDWETTVYIRDNAPQPFGDYLEMLIDTLQVWLQVPTQEFLRARTTTEGQVPEQAGSATATSTLYYYHCQSGKDRTGQVSASYYMKWLQTTWNDAEYYVENCVGDPRALSPPLELGIQWYCLQLQSQNTTGQCSGPLVLPKTPCVLPTPNLH